MAADIGSAIVTAAASKATESAYENIRRQISYVLEYKRNVKEFRDKLGDLRNHEERKKHSVEHARRKGEEIEKDVEEWLNKVKELEESTVQDLEKSIIKNEDKAKKCCFKGLSCGTLFQRYRLGKEAVEAAEQVKALFEKGNFATVSYRPVLQKTMSMYVRDYETFDSRQSKIQALMEALKDPNVKKIGVYGMGGVGKSTLVKKVAWQAIEDKLFDKLVMAEVTHTPDYKKIQEKIACDLGLEFNNETEFERRGRIRDKLKKEKGRVLIILDNIWQSFDLENDLGIPFGAYDYSKSAMQMKDSKYRKDDQKQWKIVFTSRDHKILEQDMNTEKNIRIEVLSDEEAKNLFGKIVCDLPKQPDYQSIADKIIKKCGGLPLAIETMAKALKKREPSVWEDTLNQLEVSTSRLDNVEKLYSLLKLSYNFLRSEEAKSLFLVCSLHNAGNEIYIYDLLRLGVGFGLFQDVLTFEQKRKRVFTLIDDLKASNLLMDGDTKDWVKMHDIMHLVAISIASRDNHMVHIPNATGLKQRLEDEISKESIAISVPCKDINELPETLEFPKLELFLLFLNDLSLPIPYRLFEETKKLKVLGIKGIYFPSLPSFHCLTNLRTLSLEDCLLGDIAMIGELKKLEILSFSGSDIGKLPREIGQLTRLKLLDLSNCPNLKVIIPKVISSLSQLEELYMSNSFVQWEAVGLDNQAQINASLIELMQLSHLTSLDIHVQDAQIMPQNLNFKKLQRYKIFVGDVWNWSGVYEYSRTLKLKRLINTSISSRDVISTLLRRAEDLYLDELNGVPNVICRLDSDGFPQLKRLHVQNGSEFSHIIHFVGSTPRDAFPKLESLYLHNLIKLEKICDCQLTTKSFQKLRTIKVEKCERLKNLFSVSLAKNLLELHNIEVTDCKNLTEIFSEESEDQLIQSERASEIMFKELRSLRLQYLPQLQSFGLDMKSSFRSQTLSKANMGSREIIAEDEPWDFMALFSQKVVFPCLEDLNLTSINVEKIWLDHLPAMSSYYTETLKSFTMEECNGLKFLFPSSMVPSLVQLQDLVVGYCKSMEAIIDTEEFGGEEKMIFPKLSNLVLKSLPKLTRFGFGDLVEFPSLKDLQIENCANLKIFFPSSSCPEMMIKETEELSSENCLKDILHPLFDERVAFPSLEKMKLTQLDNMQLIWHNQLHANSFCRLKELIVEDCEKLVTLIRSDTQGLLTFQNLENLDIYSCWSMKSLFPISIAASLMQLESVFILSCGLEEIVAKEEGQEAPRFVFAQLTILQLHNLPELKHFYVGFHTTEWPMLKVLDVNSCPNVQTFGSELCSLQNSYEESQPENPVQQPLFLLEMVLSNLEWLSLSRDEITLLSLGDFPADMFGKLKTLTVFGCEDESAVFLLDFLQRFYNLENLGLHGNNFKELFHLEGLSVDEGKHDVGLMPIRNLSLQDLPHLEYTWKVDSQVDPFFQNLETLQVWSCYSLTSLMPFSASLKNLTTLDVWFCDGLTNILAFTTAKNLSQLKTMGIGKCKLVREVLAYEERSTDIEIVFYQLKSLKLHGLNSLKCFSSGNYAIKFPCLEEVIVSQCPNLKIFSQSVLSTPRLKRVQLTQEKDKYAWKNDLNSTIQQMSTDMVGFHNLEYLKVSEFSHLKEKWNDQLQVSTFKYVKSLVVDEFPDIRSAIPSNLLQYLKNLETLEVRSCDSLKQMFDLERLLNADRYIWKRSHQNTLGFYNLRSLLVDNCNSLRYIFTPFIILGLVQLQEIEIRNCAVLEEIITNEEENDAAIDKINLKSITLEALPNLTSFYSGSKILCPPLETISIKDCQKICMDLESVPSEKPVLLTLEDLTLSTIISEWILHNKWMAKSSWFQNLKTFVIDGFHHVKYLFSASMVKSLVQLVELEIRNCKLMEAVIAEEEERISMLLFPKLQILRLQDLEKLSRFFDFNGSFFELSSLSCLWIENCPCMETFISCSISADMTSSEGPKEMNSKENVCTEIQTLFDKKVRLPSLKYLRIEKMDRLRKIWDYRLSLDSFFQLDTLFIGNCNKLLNVIPSNMLGIIQKLEILGVGNCDSLEEIFEVLGTSSCALKETDAKEELISRFVFPKLTLLYLEGLPSLKSLCQGMHIIEWPALKELVVSKCDKMEVFALEFQRFCEILGKQQQEIPIQRALFFVDKVSFPLLKELRLKSNKNMKEMWHGEFLEHIRKLEVLELIEFPQEASIFSSSFFHTSCNLKKLVVSDAFFEEIFLCKGFDCEERHSKALSKLRDLKLYKLPKLLHLWIENSQPCEAFQNLINLEVSECGKLENLVPSCVSFKNLASLEVSKCPGLKALMTLSTAKSFVKLTKMNIIDCEMVEEIIERVEDGGEDRIVFSQLKFLGLHLLPSLTSFCSGNFTLEFPSLEQVIVRQCPKMKDFSQGVLRTPKLRRIQLTEEEDDGCWEDDLNSTVQKLVKEMNREETMAFGGEDKQRNFP